MIKEKEEQEETQEDTLGVIEEEQEEILEESQEEEGAEESEEEGSEEKGEEQEGAESEESEESEGEEIENELTVSIGEEEEEIPEKENSGILKRFRRENRQMSKELKKLRREKQEREGPKKDDLVLGKKPTFESADYDEERFEKELTEWNDKKIQIQNKEAETRKIQEEQNKAFQDKLETYNNKKKDLPVSNFGEAEETVLESLSDTQQSIILQRSSDPALLVYALGSAPKKLDRLAKISDYVEFAFELAKIETEVKTSPKKKRMPKPEKMAPTSGKPSGAIDNNLDKLREEADKTGDYTKVLAYRKTHS